MPYAQPAIGQSLEVILGRSLIWALAGTGCNVENEAVYILSIYTCSQWGGSGAT